MNQPQDTISSDSTLSVYRALQRGAGREQVNDSNVGALIARAKADGAVQLEVLLREWRSPCGDDPAMPDVTLLQGNPPPREQGPAQ